MDEKALQQLAQQIALETLTVWEGFDGRGAAATVPHLAKALQTCARCGVAPGAESFTDWCCRRAFHLLPMRRDSALRALGVLGPTAVTPRTVGLLMRRLRGSRWQTKRIVLEALRSMCIDSKQEGLFALVLKELENPQASVRVAAAHLLVFWERHEGLPAVRNYMIRLRAGKTQAQYLLGLARDLAQVEEARENAEPPPLALRENPPPGRPKRDGDGRV
jgi:hypothetical protein